MGGAGRWPGRYAYAENTCQQPGGALLAALGEQATRTANTDIATWAFEAPAGESIAAATLWRAGDAAGGAVVNATYRVLARRADRITQTSSKNACAADRRVHRHGQTPAQPLSAENRVVVPAANLGSHLYVNASCGGVAGFKCTEGEDDANGYAAAVYLYAADIVLEQTEGPSASNVSGELASAPSVRGHERRGVQRDRSRLGRVRGGVQRRRARRAAHGGRRKRRAVQGRGADGGRAGGVPVRAAVRGGR